MVDPVAGDRSDRHQILGEQPVLHREQARGGPVRRADLGVDVLDVVAARSSAR